MSLKPARTKLIIISILIVCVAVIAWFWYPSTLPQSVAEKLAAERVDKYAREINLPKEEFVRERVEYSEQSKVWQIVYRTQKQPVHVVSILVDNFRNVELHKYIESSGN